MIIESPDDQVLDLLSFPRSAVVRLQRRVMHGANGGQAHRTNRAGVHMEETVDYPALSVWWPVSNGDNHRRLDGEIQLSKHLKPSCAIMHFSITVSVNLLLLCSYLIFGHRTSIVL